MINFWIRFFIHRNARKCLTYDDSLNPKRLGLTYNTKQVSVLVILHGENIIFTLVWRYFITIITLTCTFMNHCFGKENPLIIDHRPNFDFENKNTFLIPPYLNLPIICTWFL